MKAFTCAGSTRIEPKLDCLGRNRGKSVSWLNEKIYSEDITYLKQGDHATALPLTISYGRKIGEDFVVKENIKYKYDNMGNITKVYENGELVTEYKYDALNRLVRENNKTLNKTYVFLYDNKGNIIARKEYLFTLKCDEYLEELLPDNVEYVYSNGKLVSYNGEAIEYDVLGNPTSYRGNALSWRFGKRLMSYGSNTFDYDAEGKRTQKNDIKFVYDTEGRLFTQFSETDNIIYHYDNNSSLIGFSYQNVMYFYKKDLLENVIEILDTTGTTMVKYTYDAWGNHKVLNPDGTENTNTLFIGNINPIRYRSYYFDTETGLYFLQTRYYDPQTGRFINIDDISYLEPETINGLNLYVYCLNNPTKYVDYTGTSAIVIGLIVGAIIGACVGFGTVAYTDYQDDGEIFNGSVKWYEYVGGTVTGAVLGAGVGAVIGLGGQAIVGGLLSVGRTFAVDTFLSLVTGSNQFSSWHDYAVSFIFGGLTRYGAKIPGKISKVMSKVNEWVVVPIINELTDYIFQKKSFNAKEVVTRIILNGMFEFLKMDFIKEVF